MTITATLTSDTPERLTAAAQRAEAWFGEPFLHPGEEPDVALAAGTARRAALDDALAEIEAGRARPSAGWKVRYGLMLGLERVLTEDPPRTATGTELRLDPVNCADCGEIIAIRPVDSDDAANPDQVKGAVLIEVRMSDGSVRTVKQQSTGYKVGDRVQVNGDALAIRG